ncbi:MAG: hypothetical protein IH616_12160 [Gemmatimonadales bacterium]|nr:hypothetical protein [Gemmatimonadales bacterium]
MRVQQIMRMTLASAAAIGLLVVAACGSDNVLGPDNQVQVSNNADTFEWQATNMDNVSQTLSYDWTMTGTTADVNQSSAVTGGSATLTVTDDAGTVVYTASLGQNGTFTTDAGVAGTWTVEVRLNGTSGMVNFRLERP